jgi:hypothetical protein
MGVVQGAVGALVGVGWGGMLPWVNSGAGSDWGELRWVEREVPSFTSPSSPRDGCHSCGQLSSHPGTLPGCQVGLWGCCPLPLLLCPQPQRIPSPILLHPLAIFLLGQ